MKVAAVNTHTYGGAAVVAKRLHYALRSLGIDSLLVSRYGIPGKIESHKFFENASLRYFVRSQLANPILFPIAKKILNVRLHSNLVNKPKGYEIFSTPYEFKHPSAYRVFDDQDIIHLHWINDFIGHKSFFKEFSAKKFVWTLHDMNPITGGCHHSDGCRKFESACVTCPQLKETIDEDYSQTILKDKTEALQYLRDDQLVIVSPSHWLSDLSKRSVVTRRFRHIVIPNPSFNPVEFIGTRREIRKKLNLPVDKKIVLFVSENLNNPRKGVPLLFQAVRLINDKKSDILLVGVGHKAGSLRGLDVHYTGSISDPQTLGHYFYCADVFVTPTLAENSPLVVIESLTCGTPVVASDTGGIPDLINASNGILFLTANVDAMAKAIFQGLYEKEFDREQIMINARSIYNPIGVSKQYIDIYNSLYSR